MSLKSKLSCGEGLDRAPKKVGILGNIDGCGVGKTPAGQIDQEYLHQREWSEGNFLQREHHQTVPHPFGDTTRAETFLGTALESWNSLDSTP